METVPESAAEELASEELASEELSLELSEDCSELLAEELERVWEELCEELSDEAAELWEELLFPALEVQPVSADKAKTAPKVMARIFLTFMNCESSFPCFSFLSETPTVYEKRVKSIILFV